MPLPEVAPFADLLREHRLARRLTQGALAESARMSVDAISALERGFRRTPQRATVALLQSALALEGDDARAFEAAAGLLDIAPAPRRRVPRVSSVSPVLRDGVSRLIGRDEERDRIRAAIAPQRVVSICGTGGIGKTELALAVSRDVQSSRAFGETRFVSLAPLATPNDVVDAAARAFGLPSGLSGGDLARSLAPRSALLVLDNCEHLVTTAATLARELLRCCENLAILTTSRKPLEVGSETVVALGTLDARSAMQLFVERANEVDVRFCVDAQSAPIVADICRRLDGIALAIEIAARRTRVMSVAEIAARLDKRFRLLVNERAIEDRQRTLETLIAWSYDLLEPSEQRFFDRLSVFPDGFTLEAAHDVALGEAGDEYEALDHLQSLVTSSLVVRGTTNDGATRYGLMETLRAYGAQRLNERGEGMDSRRRLFRYVDALFTAGGAAYEREARVIALARLDVERETFAAALDAAADFDNLESAARLFARVPALRRWLRDDEIAARAKTYLQAVDSPQRRTPQMRALAAMLEIRLGNALSRIDASHSLPAFQRALDHARSGGDNAVLGRTLVANALGLMRLRRFEDARGALEEASRLESSAEARKELRHTRALLALYAGDGETAAAMFAEIALDERLLDNEGFEFDALHCLGEAHVVCGNVDAALEAAAAADPLVTRVGPHPRAAFRSSCAAYACFAGDATLALGHAREALEMRPRDNVWPHALRHAALACAMLGYFEHAARLDGRADERMRAHAFPGYATERIARDRLDAILRAEFDVARLRALRLEGARATDDDAFASLPIALGIAPRKRLA